MVRMALTFFSKVMFGSGSLMYKRVVAISPVWGLLAKPSTSIRSRWCYREQVPPVELLLAPPGRNCMSVAPNGVFGIYIAHINLICSSELLILILLPINTFTYRQHRLPQQRRGVLETDDDADTCSAHKASTIKMAATRSNYTHLLQLYRM